MAQTNEHTGMDNKKQQLVENQMKNIDFIFLA